MHRFADDHQLPEMAQRSLRHELRTPVNHIIGYSEMLLEEAAEYAAPERFDPLHEVVAAGRAMLEVIGRWLDQPASLDLSAALAAPLDVVAGICRQLTEQAVSQGPHSFAADLATIAGAAAQLGSLAAAAQPPSASADALDALAPEPRAGTLLLVDDDDLNRQMLARRLERLGYQICQAVHGRHALELLNQQPFDLVLLDLLMPELDGYGVLTAMRADPQLRSLPVIALSALDDPAHVIRAIELGADDYLPRPFNPVLLQARIGACLFRKRLNDQAEDYLRRIEGEKRRADHLLDAVIPLGVAFSVERNYDQLLERIVVEAQNLCDADGGTLYLLAEEQKLRFVIVRTRSLDIAMGGASGRDIPFPPLRLYDETSGEPLLNYVVTRAAHEGRTINIADAYNADGYDFSGTREFDARTGYRTTSVLTIPLRDGERNLVGVLQLINAQAGRSVIPFDNGAAQTVESFAALAAAALAAYAREQQLRQEIQDLRIEIDQQRKQREVVEITDSAYFQSLQQRAKSLRNRGRADSAEDPQAAPRVPVRRVYSVNGHEIVVREQGPARGRLLLLIHGWSSSWYALSPLLPHLSERYRCVAVDLPGYGESPPLDEPATIPGYAALLAALIRELSPGLPAVLVGHSMGGMTSVTLALHHPELVERMVLLCPTISGKLSYWINWFIAPITMLERSRAASGIVAKLEPHLLSVTDRLMRPASFAERTGISEADYRRLRADARRPGQGRVRAECFRAMQDNDLRGYLRGISTPAQVIWGMEDNTVPLRDASVVADEWPGAELIVLPKSGHWPQFENPEVTRRHIRSFLGRPLKLLRAQL